MRISVGKSLIVVVVCSILLCAIILYETCGLGVWNVTRLVVYRLVLPSVERRVCAVKRRIATKLDAIPSNTKVSHEDDSEEACDVLHQDFIKEKGSGFWAETIQATASEIVSKAHAELHFTQRILLLGSTEEDEQQYIGEDLLELGSKQILGGCQQRDGATQTPLFRAWLLQGFSLANVLLGEYEDSLMLIDTGDTPGSIMSMLSHFNNHTCQPNKPVKLVLISHYHTDHIGGIGGVSSYNEFLNCSIAAKVIAHQDTARAITQYFLIHPQASLRRAQKQFGVSKHVSRPRLKHARIRPSIDNPTMPGVISAGIGLSLEAVNLDDDSEETSEVLQYPTHTWASEKKTFDYNGHDIVMMKSPGETADQITFYLPTLKIFFISDNFYFAFPNIYPLRGGVFRNPANWWQSLEAFLVNYSDKTHVLAMGHTSPVFGQNLIRLLVERYRDSIQFVRDQTIRLMNHLDDTDVIARNVARLFWRHFPKLNSMPHSKSMLKSMPALLVDPVMPFYGQLHWAAKAVVFYERGWFGGRVEEVNSHRVSLATRYRKLRDLINDPNANIMKAIHDALSTYDCQWALELTTIAMAPRTHFGLPTSPTFEVCLDHSDAAALDDPGLQELFDEWRGKICDANRTAEFTWSSAKMAQEDFLMESDLIPTSDQEDEEKVCRHYTDEAPSSVKCARRQALWCLARRELPSSGRNWYILDALTEKQKASDEADTIRTAHKIRNSFLKNAPDLMNVLHSFPSRLEPGIVSYSNIPTVFRLQIIQDESRDVEAFKDFNPLTYAGNTTVDIISRNSILVIQTSQTLLAHRDPADPNFIEIFMRWSTFRKVVLKSYPTGPLRLWAQAEIWFENERSRDQRFRDFCKFLELLIALEHE